MRKYLLLGILLVFPTVAFAGDTKQFPEAKHGKGELRYIDEVPVLIIRGKPNEIGEQFGKLAIENAPDLLGLHARFLKDSGQENRYPLLKTFAGLLRPNFPPHVLAEMEAAAKTSKQEL